MEEDKREYRSKITWEQFTFLFSKLFRELLEDSVQRRLKEMEKDK